MENKEIYNRVREVPKNAQKTIQAGRLKGMTDINPQWRIEKLTEVFGPVGIGWFAKEIKREFVDGANEEKACFVDIELFIKVDGEWSKPIYGTGGSTFIAKESKGLYTSDEVVKMAYTDAISVACKQLGFGADIYWNKSDSKYCSSSQNDTSTKQKVESISSIQKNKLKELFSKCPDGYEKKTLDKIGVKEIGNLSKAMADVLISQLTAKVGEVNQNN